MDLLRVDGQKNVQAAAPPFVFQKRFGDTDATAILFQDRLYLGQVIDKGIGVAVRVSS